LFLLILSVFGLYIYASTARGQAAAVDGALALVASQVVAGLDVENGRLIFAEQFADEPENIDLRERGFTIRILTPEGRTLQAFGAYQTLLALITPSTSSFATLTGAPGDPPVRVYTTPIAESSNRPIAFVQVAQSLEAMQNTLQGLQATFLVSVPLLVTIAGVSGYFLAARALVPIDRITRTARRISAEELSARLDLAPTDDEVGRLAATFDAMLTRLEDAFRRERQFVADASHELRTPLAAMQVILGAIRQQWRTPGEYEQALADLSEETDRLRTLTEELLQLARRDTRRPPPYQRVELSPLLRDVADSMRPLAEAKGLRLTCVVTTGLALPGDSDDLIRLFVNLLDNAVKFTVHGGVTLSASEEQPHGVRVMVEDTGIGISAEHLPRIFDRFYRVDKARTTGGAGLGLALASDIVRAHSGRIEVASEVGKGTRFTVYF
jgi:heavy metal sensor kinase